MVTCFDDLLSSSSSYVCCSYDHSTAWPVTVEQPAVMATIIESPVQSVFDTNLRALITPPLLPIS